MASSGPLPAGRLPPSSPPRPRCRLSCPAIPDASVRMSALRLRCGNAISSGETTRSPPPFVSSLPPTPGRRARGETQTGTMRARRTANRQSTPQATEREAARANGRERVSEKEARADAWSFAPPGFPIRADGRPTSLLLRCDRTIDFGGRSGSKGSTEEERECPALERRDGRGGSRAGRMRPPRGFLSSRFCRPSKRGKETPQIDHNGAPLEVPADGQEEGRTLSLSLSLSLSLNERPGSRPSKRCAARDSDRGEVAVTARRSGRD
ncbi:hypothetical protein ACHAWF_000939 [Thalassiosira exigua]